MPLSPEEKDFKDTQKMEDAYDMIRSDDDRDIDAAARDNLERHSTKLGDYLHGQFDEYKSQREQSIESRWLKDLRQYRGEYDPEVKQRMPKNKSKAFMGETRTKVRTFVSRMMDLLFPANGDRNFSIDPTPVPDLHADAIRDIQEQFVMRAEPGPDGTTQPPTPEDIKMYINQEASRRADAMEDEITDQLSELKYADIIRNVVNSGAKYGTGILKGPLVKQSIVQKYLPHPNDPEEWVPIEVTHILPACEYVSVWDMYINMAARTPEQLGGIFQRHLMNKNHLIDLMDRTDFNKAVIKAYLLVESSGDATYYDYENQMMSMNSNDTEPCPSNPKRNKYEVLEFWGYIPSDELEMAGVKIPEELRGLEVAANIWMIGNYIIKAVIAPVKGVVLPYYFFYYDKDESSFYGSGLPTITRDPQKILNACVRAMLDNAALSSGGIFEVNEDMLSPNEDARDMHANKVIRRQGIGQEGAIPALRVSTIPNYSSNYMSMIEMFKQMFDDISALPRVMHGEQTNMGSAGQTVRGLSMLMGAANITLKDQVRNFDEGVTKPYIKAHYKWNMEFNKNNNLKGDFSVIPRGSSSLIAREVKVQSILEFLQITANEMDNQYINREQGVRILEQQMELDGMGLVKDEYQIQKESSAQAAVAKKQREFEMILELMKAQSGGHMQPLPDETRILLEEQLGLPKGALNMLQPSNMSGRGSAVQGDEVPVQGQQVVI